MMSRKPSEFDDFPDSLTRLAPFGPYRAVVKRWVDGDTCYLLADVGFSTYPYIVVRIADINAPELRTGEDREAGAAARDYALQLAPEGTPVVLHSEPDTLTFGRWVGALTLPDGRDFGQAMIEAGHAVVMER
jgi:endonuclease YncB( thermonuclease family)